MELTRFRASLPPGWEALLEGVMTEPSFIQLMEHLDQEYASHQVYPKQEDLFRALQLTDVNRVKVVILGQDPYHGPGQAHGLSFSVQPGVPIPPSLRNIFQELHDDLGCPIPAHGSLIHWAREGVLLLNTVLSVRDGEPNSHKGLGWERFTNRIIELLQARRTPLVFLLWGRHAQAKRALIQEERHLVLASAHPSPLSARHGFFGSRPFSRTNKFLQENRIAPVHWEIPPHVL